MNPVKFLISGFEPSFGIRKTPSGQISKILSSGMISIPGVEIHGIVLPQVFRLSTETLLSKSIEISPDYIIMLGANPGHTAIRVEQFALNIEHSLSGDNTQIPVLNREIKTGGEPACKTQVDCGKVVQHLLSQKINAEVSHYAGTHTCNSLYYEVLSHLQMKPTKCKALFVHMPYPNEYGVIESSSQVRESDLTSAVVSIIEHLSMSDNSTVPYEYHRQNTNF